MDPGIVTAVCTAHVAQFQLHRHEMPLICLLLILRIWVLFLFLKSDYLLATMNVCLGDVLERDLESRSADASIVLHKSAQLRAVALAELHTTRVSRALQTRQL